MSAVSGAAAAAADPLVQLAPFGADPIARRLDVQRRIDQQETDGIGPNLTPSVEGSVPTDGAVLHAAHIIHRDIVVNRGSPFRISRTMQPGGGAAALHSSVAAAVSSFGQVPPPPAGLLTFMSGPSLSTANAAPMMHDAQQSHTAASAAYEAANASAAAAAAPLDNPEALSGIGVPVDAPSSASASAARQMQPVPTAAAAAAEAADKHAAQSPGLRSARPLRGSQSVPVPAYAGAAAPAPALFLAVPLGAPLPAFAAMPAAVPAAIAAAAAGARAHAPSVGERICKVLKCIFCCKCD